MIRASVQAPRAAAHRVVRKLPLVALCATTMLAAITPPARAQSQSAPHRTPRSKILAIAGGVVGGLLGLGIWKSASSGKGGGCAGIPCMIIGSAAGGAALGYLIGRDYDRTYAARYRGVAPLHLASTTADLDGEPVALAVSDSTIAVAGSVGVELFAPTPNGLREEARRAGGLRAISVLAIAPRTEWLVLGSPVGLYLFPPHRGPGALVLEGDIGAAAAASDRVYVATGDRIEIFALTSDSTRSWTGASLGAPVRDLAVDPARPVLWAVTDRDLVSYRIADDSLARLGAAALGGAGRRLAVSHDTVAVALGTEGVRLFDTSDPAAPRTTADWSVAHFVYDISIDRGRLFAAAGPEGVYVVDMREGRLRPLGLARSLGFASALASRGGYTYILDRRSNVLRRIRSDF